MAERKQKTLNEKIKLAIEKYAKSMDKLRKEHPESIISNTMFIVERNDNSTFGAISKGGNYETIITFLEVLKRELLDELRSRNKIVKME